MTTRLPLPDGRTITVPDDLTADEVETIIQQEMEGKTPKAAKPTKDSMDKSLKTAPTKDGESLSVADRMAGIIPTLSKVPRVLDDALRVGMTGATAGALDWGLEKSGLEPGARTTTAEARTRVGHPQSLEITGGVLSGLAGPGLATLAGKVPGLLGTGARMGLSAAEGAGYGATSAATSLDPNASVGWGTLLGAGFGAGGQALGEGVSAGAKWLQGLDPREAVASLFARNPQAAQELSALGPEGIVADVGGEPGRALVRGISDKSPEARQILLGTTGPRQARQPQKIIESVEDAAQIAPEHRLTPDEMIEQLRETRRPGIQNAYVTAQEAGFKLPRETRARTIQEPIPPEAPGTSVAERATGGTVERRMGLQFASARGDITPAIKIDGQIHTTPGADRHQTVMADLTDKHYFDPEMRQKMEGLEEDAFGFINKNGEFKNRDDMADELGLGVGPVPPKPTGTRSRVVEEETEIPSFFGDLITKSPTVRRAWRKAGEDRKDWRLTEGDVVDSDLWRLDATKKNLDGLASEAFRAGNRTKGRKIAQLAEAVRTRMDGLLELPEYAAARGKHESMEGEIAAINRGADLAKPRYDATLPRDAFAAREGPQGHLLGPAQAQGYGHAKAAQLRGNRTLNQDVGSFRSQLSQEGAHAALGDRAGIIEEAVRRADTFTGTHNAIGAGSQTSRNLQSPLLQAIKDNSLPAILSSGPVAYGIMTGNKTALATGAAAIMSWAASKGYSALRARQLADRLPEIARILTGQNIPTPTPFRVNPLATKTGSAAARAGGLLGAR